MLMSEKKKSTIRFDYSQVELSPLTCQYELPPVTR